MVSLFAFVFEFVLVCDMFVRKATLVHVDVGFVVLQQEI